MEWSEAEDQGDTPTRIDPKFHGLTPVAFEVRGAGMNAVFLHGTTVICVAYAELGRGPLQGERVVAQRLRGGESEVLILEYRCGADGGAWLWPLSDDPDFQTPLRLDGRGARDTFREGDEGETIVVSHKVMRAEIDQP